MSNGAKLGISANAAIVGAVVSYNVGGAVVWVTGAIAVAGLVGMFVFGGAFLEERRRGR